MILGNDNGMVACVVARENTRAIVGCIQCHVPCARGLKFGHQIFRLFWFVRFSLETKHFLSLNIIL